MLAWYASSPEHGGNPDLAYPPPSSPHFRSNMQSPGPPYQGTLGSGMNYSERPYENQMGSHCQSNSYPSYQPPSPYRPHPVSPPAHAHQYSSHGTPQMHSTLPYSSGHQLGSYGSSQSHYGSINQEMYGSRPSLYSTGGRSIQQLKPTWGDNSNSSSDIMQYNQSLPRPPMMPPPPMHSPPHASMSTTPGPPPPPPHYRQMPIVSSSSHSPHSWSQSQIPSPSVLHSPRTTPSPLPNPTRSPGHSQPFSPPPSAPSPHHPPPPMTPHPQTQKPAPSPPTTVSSGSSQQPLCNSPSSQVGNTDPLQSLQKMVMLDSETVESPITRASYEMAASQGNPPVTSRPSSYFSVEQLAGSDPGSPYPTYYNLDQNRLCTPPRTCMSTPTSSTFSSAPDSTSSNSPRSDSRTTTASADSSTVGHVNGELPQSDNQGRRQDFDSFGVTDVRITNGNHPGDISARDEFGPVSSDSENKDSQDFIHHLGNNSDIPDGDGRVDLRTAIRKSPKSPRGRRRVTGQELHSDPLLMENPLDKLPRNKTILMTAGRRNSTLQEFEITNGQPEVTAEENYQNDGFTSRPVRYFSPAGRWNRIPNMGDNFTSTQEKNCFTEDCIGVSVTAPTKRGRRRKNFASHDGMPEWDLPYNNDMGIQRPPRAMRNPSRGRRGGRRRGSGVFPVGSGYGETHLDMYHNENHHLSARSHPANGLSEVGNVNPSEKSMTWQSHGLHISTSQGIGTEYNLKDDVSLGAKPPIMESLPINNSTVNSALPNAQQPVPYNSDIPPEDRARGPLIFTVTKDGNTVKLQEGPLPNAASSQQQFYDSSLGQVAPQPPKKKRGRPFGSKNKPKPPGEVRQPRRRRRKGEIALEVDQMQVVKKPILGPYIHIVGTREKPITVMVVNVQVKEEEKDVKLLKQKRQLQLGNAIRQKLGLGPCSTLSPLYDAVSKDKSWLCALCCKGNHYQGQGDLFGPYYLNGDQKPSTVSNPSSPAPPTVSGTSDAAEGEGEDEHQDAVDIMSNGPLRRVRAKRRSELVEQFFKTALYKKAKQLKEQSLKRSESDDEVETVVDEVVSPVPKDEQLKVVLKDEKTSRENELQKLPPSYTPEVKLTLMTPSILMTGRDASVPDVMHNMRDFKIKHQNGAQSSINIISPEEESVSEMQQNQKCDDIPESTHNVDVQPSSPSEFQVDTPTDNKEFWVHEDCALWSHGVYLIGDKMYGLEDAVLEAAEMVCSKCKFSGASLGCLNKGCTEQYHYLCARDKGCEMDEDNFSILCPKHKKKPRTEKQSADG